MKKLNVILGTFMVAVVALLASCNPDPETYVTITVDTNNVSIAPGESYTFEITMTPDMVEEGQVGDMTIAEGSVVLDSASFNSSSEVKHSFTYTVASDAVEGTDISLAVEVFDAVSGNGSTETISITVGAVPNVVVSHTALTLNYDNGSTGFASSTPMLKIEKDMDNATVNCTVVGPEEGNVGLVYQSQYGNALASPDASWLETMYTINGASYSANGKTHTKLMKFTGDYDALTVEDIQNMTVTEEYLAGNDANGVAVDNLASGDYVAFETADGVKGVFKVTASKGTEKGTKATSDITMDVKVLYEAGAGTTK